VFQYITNFPQFLKPTLLHPTRPNGYMEEQRIADRRILRGSFGADSVARGVRLGYAFVDNNSWAVCILILDTILTSFPL
jgi:hypothetical protein